MEANRNAVADAVWNWRSAAVKKNQSSGRHAGKAVAEAAIMASVGAFFFWKFHKLWLAGVIWALAGIVLVGGLFIPPLYAGFKKAGSMLATGVGIAVSWILLVPFFYICFTVGRLALLATGKDPMQRRFSPEMKSYWTPHARTIDPASYTRQY